MEDPAPTRSLASPERFSLLLFYSSFIVVKPCRAKAQNICPVHFLSSSTSHFSVFLFFTIIFPLFLNIHRCNVTSWIFGHSTSLLSYTLLPLPRFLLSSAYFHPLSAPSPKPPQPSLTLVSPPLPRDTFLSVSFNRHWTQLSIPFLSSPSLSFCYCESSYLLIGCVVVSLLCVCVCVLVLFVRAILRPDLMELGHFGKVRILWPVSATPSQCILPISVLTTIEVHGRVCVCVCEHSLDIIIIEPCLSHTISLIQLKHQNIFFPVHNSKRKSNKTTARSIL